MTTNNRKCEVCGNNDFPCVVHSSDLGGMSFNYCLICSAMGAEPTGLVDCGYISYNHNDDMYYDKSDNHIPIKLQSGRSFNTRADFIKFHKKINDDK